MISRVEERIDQELLPAYYKAYDAVGDKESLAYPEEVPPHPSGRRPEIHYRQPMAAVCLQRHGRCCEALC